MDTQTINVGMWQIAGLVVIAISIGGATALGLWFLARRKQRTSKAIISNLGTEELKSQALMNSIAEGIAVISLGRQIQLLNPAGQKLAGWDEASARDIDYRRVFKILTAAGTELDDATDPVVQVLRTGSSMVRDDLSLLTGSKSKIEISLSVSPVLNAKRQILGAIILIRDISHEKAIEREKSDFISTASHEMRTPVATIEGYLGLAMTPATATVDERAMEYLRKAHDTTQYLGTLLKNLLSITKAEDKQINERLEPVDIGKMIQAVVNDLQVLAQKRNLTITIESSSLPGREIIPPYIVMVNPERIKEVLINLIDNAIKFTTQGGVYVTVTADKTNVTASVADTGPGIAQADIPHLFQKFYRIDNSTTRAVGGTGLGLYLSRITIERYNGRMWAESQPGKGSTFSFSLPLASTGALPVEAPSAVAVPITTNLVNN